MRFSTLLALIVFSVYALLAEQQTYRNAYVIPAKLSQCEGDKAGTHCDGTWEFHGDEGSGSWTSGTVAALTVVRFTFDGIEIHRTDPSGRAAGLTAVYTGQVHGDRLYGDVTWTWPGHWNNQSQSGTWYAKVVEPAAYSVLNMSDPCSASTSVSAHEALERGTEAIHLKNMGMGTCWLRLSASTGNPEAQGFLAAILYKGIGVPINIPEAVQFAQKAADANDYVGERCLWLMYKDGVGLTKNAERAEHWRAKAELDKLASIYAAQEADEKLKQQEMHSWGYQPGRPQPQVQLSESGQFLLLQILIGAFAADFGSHSSSGSASNIGGANRYEEYKQACAAGYSAACHQINEQVPFDPRRGPIEIPS